EMYIPEEAVNRDPAVFYEDWYGIFGKIYYQLGLHNLYSSWWYMILIALIGVSLLFVVLIVLYRFEEHLKCKNQNAIIHFLVDSACLVIRGMFLKKIKRKWLTF